MDTHDKTQTRSNDENEDTETENNETMNDNQ